MGDGTPDDRVLMIHMISGTISTDLRHPPASGDVRIVAAERHRHRSRTRVRALARWPASVRRYIGGRWRRDGPPPALLASRWPATPPTARLPRRRRAGRGNPWRTNSMCSVHVVAHQASNGRRGRRPGVTTQGYGATSPSCATAGATARPREERSEAQGKGLLAARDHESPCWTRAAQPARRARGDAFAAVAPDRR